jgi:hypothetical protein
MKKYSLLIAGLLLIGLSSCGNSSSTVSSSSEEGLNSPEDYLACINQSNEYCTIKNTFSISKDGKIYKSGFDAKAVNVDTKVEHLYGRSESIVALDGIGEEAVSSYDIYKGAGLTYTLGEDNKYKVENADNTFANYHISFDFSKCSSLNLSVEGFNAKLSGEVTSDNVKGFFKKDSIDGVSGVAFSAVLTKLEGYLNSFTVNYDQNGYTVKNSFDVSSSAPNISMPTI